MMDALDTQAASLRGLDAVLTRLEANVDTLPSRAFIARALVRDVVATAAAMALAGGSLVAIAMLVRH